MRLICIHCGQPFTITADQLGGQGSCPHCRGLIELPAAADDRESPAWRPQRRSHWLENWASALASVVVHMLIIVLLALSYEQGSGEGLGEEVLIGSLPGEELVESEELELQTSDVESQQSLDQLEQMLEIDTSSATNDSAADGDLAISDLSPSGSASGSFDLGAINIGGGAMSGGSWDGMLQSLRRNGLDIVLAFDSTGSMSGEIDQVKQQMRRIGTTLTRLIPKSRISICTYRDAGDAYVVKGLPLTSDVNEVETYLSGISAAGGGDRPEAVHEGLHWAVQYNQFRPRARKVILVFGDAPPHAEYLNTCLRLAGDFYSQQGGVVSTVTCRAAAPLEEFYDIARAGNGEAFLTADEKQIMTQLMVLVFGSQYRSKVVEAFRLLDQ